MLWEGERKYAASQTCLGDRGSLLLLPPPQQRPHGFTEGYQGPMVSPAALGVGCSGQEACLWRGQSCPGHNNVAG